ncbi:terpene synthase family protein [Nocardia crassostreae]|uniref:terpene synthase family protein n=1 Tax=Nocardia crassostreae TaxID=53428 RepID=UPI0008334859|nr:hypothetical protein [Nocardia crassostreae]
MQPFHLPDFYLPHPARRNPHLDHARAHAAAWAKDVGILDEPGPSGELVWDADRLDRMEIALLCAYTHPDCDAEALALITEWYMWVLFFDDDFLAKFKNTGRRAEAVRHLERLELFMAEPGCAAPEPGNPAEAGLADCWVRTIVHMSPDWRRRMRLSTHNLMVESLWELDNIARERVANPIECIEMRRRVGGAPWSANLVEYACGAEVPDRLADERPLRVLLDTFSDAVHLRNDLFSYDREAGPLAATGVRMPYTAHANPHFGEVCAELPGWLADLRQFEHLVGEQLPVFFADHDLSAAERVAILAYAGRMQDLMSGHLAWFDRTGRYAETALRERHSKSLCTGPTGPFVSVLAAAAGIRSRPGAALS